MDLQAHIRSLALVSLSLLAGFSVHAQAPQQADFIVAVVNSEPITNAEVRSEVRRITLQLEQQRQAVPPTDELRRLVLERMINDRVQLQLARDTGIRVDAAAVDQAEQGVARQNQIDLPALHQRLAKDGVNVATFRAQLRDQLTLSRLHERDVEGRIRISDQDVDRFLQDQQNNNVDPLTQDINLAQILIAVPEKASAEQTALIFQQAQKVLGRIRAGEDFGRLVQELSAADRNNGGQLGLRRADRYPLLFVTATQQLGVGGVSEIVRSGAGFHILKVLEKRAPATVTRFVVQSHARHILLRTDAKLSQAAALARLADVKQRIQTGKSTFQAEARTLSQDGSAEQGGDLGWANPGMFVPEFEEVMNRLNEGDISNPTVSRFGVHLIQLIERRRVELSPQQVRESVRNQLRESRYEESYSTWAQELRARAFVEMREPPQ
jgi:peptidyl-prolyl cis-trans isomerase SurA